MTHEPKNPVAVLIERWPTAGDLAIDLGLPNDEKSARTVRAWKLRGSIPSAYWARLVAAAQRRGFADVTLELLASMAAQRVAEASAGEAA